MRPEVRRWRRRADARQRRTGKPPYVGFYCCPLAVGTDQITACPVHGAELGALPWQAVMADALAAHGLALGAGWHGLEPASVAVAMGVR